MEEFPENDATRRDSWRADKLSPVGGIHAEKDSEGVSTGKVVRRILIIEDNAIDAKLVVEEVERVGFRWEWQRVQTESEYPPRLDAGFDLVPSDYRSCANRPCPQSKEIAG